MHSFRNNIQLEGNLGKDAELKTTASGDVVRMSRADHPARRGTASVAGTVGEPEKAKLCRAWRGSGMRPI